MPKMIFKSLLAVFPLFGAMLNVPCAGAQSGQAELIGDIAGPVAPLPPNMNENRLFAELLAHNERRNAALAAYTEERTYAVTDTSGRVRAQETGQMEYHAPDKKTFATTSESGSGIVRRLALGPLIAGEIEAASAKQHHDSAITPANYALELIGEQQVGPYRCIVVRATPKRQDKYLFEGTVWIDSEDYAVVRIVGHPAKKLSFWLERVDFVREYQKIDGFWLSQKDQTFVQVRMYGEKILTIDHRNYRVTPGINPDEQVSSLEN
jgi:hypothetical protein